jgi:hypothetical protein
VAFVADAGQERDFLLVDVNHDIFCLIHCVSENTEQSTQDAEVAADQQAASASDPLFFATSCEALRFLSFTVDLKNSERRHKGKNNGQEEDAALCHQDMWPGGRGRRCCLA